MNGAVITRLRQNAVNLISRDQDVRALANIVAELCMVCEEQEKLIGDLQERLESLPETRELDPSIGSQT